MSIVVGLIGAVALIAGAVYLAVRPYVRHDLMPGGRKPWMPDLNGKTDFPDSRIDGHGATSDAGWLSMVMGVIGGLTLIAGAVYLAVRPYLRHDLMPGRRKPWMPDSTGRKRDTGAPTGENWLLTGHRDGHL